MSTPVRSSIYYSCTVEYLCITFEPPRDKTNKITCAPSEDSDQPGHPPSLIRVFACAQWVAKDPSFLHADSEDSDQTGRMQAAQSSLGAHAISLVLSRDGSFFVYLK